MKESIAVIDGNGNLLKSVNAVLPIYSITKTMIASIVLDLDIDLESRISEWIPGDICRHSEIIKVRHLLNHSSGIKDYGGMPEYDKDVKNRALPWPDRKFIEATLDREILFQPGDGFSYSNPGYWLLKRIIEIESGLSFDELIENYIAKPLNASSIQVAHGVFDDSLNGYRAEWVWHGLVLANAADVARFMASDKASRLNACLNKVETNDEHWKNPHYGLGLMVDPGIKVGHLGGGPGYEAACIRFLESNLCICAILSSEKRINPLAYVIQTYALS